LFASGNGVVRGFSFQKVPNGDWHGPRSHINRVGPVKTTDPIPAEIVQIGIEDGGNLRPFFVVAKNLAVPNYSDNLAGVRIDNIALEHVLLFCVFDVTFTTPNSPRCSALASISDTRNKHTGTPLRLRRAPNPAPPAKGVRWAPRLSSWARGFGVALP
jgi:hypothetical protein